MKNLEILNTQFDTNEPQYGLCTKFPFLSNQIAKIKKRIGNDQEGWRYELEYKNGKKRYPPTFEVENKTKEEYEKQPIIPYEPDTWK